MMNTSTLIYFFLSSLLLAALPGPAMMMTIQGAIAQGWKQGIRITTGILLADIVLLCIVCLGIGSVLTSSPTLLLLMNVFSSLYLLYLGVISLLEIRHIKAQVPILQNKTDWQTGFLITLINPKTIVFLLAYFPQFIEPQSHLSETMQLVILSIWFVIAVAVIMLAYTFSAHAARQFLTSMKARCAMSMIFGCLLIGIGLQGLYQMLSI